MSETTITNQTYFVPNQSKWPFLLSLAIFIFVIGFTLLLNDGGALAPILFSIGLVSVLAVVYAWFRSVITESIGGNYNFQVDVSFRWGMCWFIFSEVLFFGAFFGALFYTKLFSLAWLAGELGRDYNQLIWSDFIYTWPLLTNPDPETVPGPAGIIEPLGLPLINTILLITSSFTVSLAHKALKSNKRNQISLWLLATIIFGIAFLFFQGEEYVHAYQDLGLTLNSGVYGSLFFILTGFHGMHVTLGTLMLIIILFRVLKGHFTPEHHFGFEAVSWYWHFVDVVWIGLFVFVYIF